MVLALDVARRGERRQQIRQRERRYRQTSDQRSITADAAAAGHCTTQHVFYQPITNHRLHAISIFNHLRGYFDRQ